MKERIRNSRFIAICLAIALIFSCKSPQEASKEEKGAVIGAAGGAVLGGILSDNTVEGALLGGVLGGVTGAYIGTKMDQQAQEIRTEVPDAQVQRMGEGIKIAFDEAAGANYETLDAEARDKLDRLANVFKQYPNTNILIEGHSADLGNRSQNLNSSKNRAQAVADYLVERGLSRDRLTTTWRGATEATYGSPEKNNRVELAVVANEELRREAREAAKEE